MSDAKSVLAALAKAGVNVQSLSADSRRVNPGDVFVAMKGHHSDGRDYLAEAKANGAAAVIYEAGKTPVGAGDTPLVVATDIASFIGELASEVYGHPSQKLWLAGVTGTNGKTSVSQWLAQSLNRLNDRCAVIGTLGNGFPDALVDSPNTTPDAISLHATLASFVKQNARACAMEVSSIGLHQHRVDGASFKVAILTDRKSTRLNSSHQ